MTDRIRTEFEKWATGREFPDLTQSMSREAILRRNIADMEVALRTQTDRAEAAEAELARLAQQKPVAWMHDKDGRVDTCHDSVKEMWIKVGQKQNTQFMREMVPCRVEHYNIPLYAAPVTTPHKGATHCDDCGLTWLDDGLNPLRCPYCKDAGPAPAVPDSVWRDMVSEMLNWWDDQHMTLSQGRAIREKARALLQSTEVRHD